MSLTNRGDAATGDVDIPWRRVAAAPRLPRGYSAETSRGDAGCDVDVRSRPALSSGTKLSKERAAAATSPDSPRPARVPRPPASPRSPRSPRTPPSARSSRALAKAKELKAAQPEKACLGKPKAPPSKKPWCGQSSRHAYLEILDDVGVVGCHAAAEHVKNTGVAAGALPL